MTKQSKNPCKGVYAITLFFLIMTSLASGQEKFSKKQLEEDLSILKNSLEEIHGGLYAYSSETEINDWFLQAKNKVKDSMNRFEFYKIVAPLNGIIKNGHTDISYPKFGDKFNLLPLSLYKHKDSFYIKEVFLDVNKELIALPITKIDGIAIKEVFDRLMLTATRDGDNTTLPKENLLALFSLSYPLAYGTKTSYEITVIKDRKEVTVPIKSTLLSDKLISKYYNQRPEKKPLSFKIKDGIAIISFLTFDKTTLKKAKYKAFLANAFAEIKTKKIQHLILDVRNNGGGDPVPTQELLSYVLDKEFRMYNDVYTITNKIKNRKYFKKQGVFWLNLLSFLKIKKIRDGHYRLRSDQGMDVYMPKTNSFDGKLYVLTNGKSFSATGEFTSFVKDNTNAIFIGEEVGGNKIQNTSGVSYTITLPNSKQKAVIPIVIWEMNVAAENNAHGVQPDYWVRNTIQEELNKIDAVMKFAEKLIKEQG